MKAGSLTDRIARVLFNYRITPQTTTGLLPAELLMGRRLSSRLYLMIPRGYNGARNFAPRAKANWLPGEVVQKTGPLSCQVQLQDGTVWRRHQDHIHKHFTEQSEDVATPLETVPQEEL